MTHPRAKLAFLSRPDPNEPPIINLEIEGRFVQAQLTEGQRRGLVIDAALFAPPVDDEFSALVGACAALEGRVA